MKAALRAAVWGAAGSGCGSYPTLAGQSAEARAVADFWWLSLAVTGIPALATLSALLIGALRRSRSDAAGNGRRGLWVVLAFGVVMPLGIVALLLIRSVRLGQRLTAVGATPSLTIDVIGRQFWWEVRYPDHGVVTANEIHVPAGRQVRLRLASGDVIHSFWVPALGGKRDMVPGQINELWVRADESGVYRGQCAELCGVQHALMAFEVVADGAEEFAAWLQRTREKAREPTDAAARRGLRVFRQAQCAHCHMVRGVTPELALGAIGPDLTHFAGRRTLGAALVANNRGNLGGWILDPQSLKPGNFMPASQLAPGDFHALVRFLETLQ